MNEDARKEIGRIAERHGLHAEYDGKAIVVSEPVQLYGKENEHVWNCSDGLCHPMPMFDMIEQCGICGKII
ncbi:hypothetical protein ASG38_15120 [Flavobacterium sp. Leaf359]|uniref:hypothetical protein n=1 Tax=Flavobacterium sp. Leaf359 TaxID=1736351 RepID=UPI0006F8C261|nr:hypothetical protein [Flavobacterium sp. Leaf359]KQS45938.1 hypothetical protein ASG38_15120 [Flavobacterium sp. Leaf359]